MEPESQLHILGICGTFMGGLALLARGRGYRVTGADANVYPPMSTQLQASGIRLTEGYDPGQLQPHPEIVVIGNAMSRGNPSVEYILERGIRYTSGPQWLADHILADRWVLAVAGTHGKTTTAAMLAWILSHAGLEPGFLIGGIPNNFGVSARLGADPFFVVEADEYDTAFFDKRSKFVHYRPRTLILNNLEYDHADIFDDLASIQRQFHHLVRTVPANGLIVHPLEDGNIASVLRQGCWTPCETLDPSAGGQSGWHLSDISADGTSFRVACGDRAFGTVTWELSGLHNRANALAAIAAARHAGVPPSVAIEALSAFQGVRRRLELCGTARGVTVYDDFAHHPTAISSTLDGLRAVVEGRRIIAVLEPRSNTMRLGIHGERLAAALAGADRVLFYQPRDLRWDPADVLASLREKVSVFEHVEGIVQTIAAEARRGDSIVIMSNGGFGGIRERLLQALADDSAA